MYMPFKSMTTTSIYSLYSFILTSSSTYCVTSPFLVLSALYTSNDLFIGFVLIFSSFTSCLLIPVWVHPESTSACSHSSFLFDVLTFVCIFSSLSLLFLKFGITYWLWALNTEILCTVPTLDLHQNSLDYYPSHYLFLSGCYYSSSSVLICSL